MDLLSVLAACVRRWWVLLPLLAITAFASVTAYERVGLDYVSSGTYVLVQPASVPIPQNGDLARNVNPIVSSGGARQLAEIVAGRVMSDVAQEQLKAAGVTSEVAVSLGVSTPTLTLSITGSDPSAVVTDSARLVEALVTQTSLLQQEIGAPADQYFSPVVGTPLSEPAPQTGSAVRSAGAVALAGIALSVLAAALVDSILQRWQVARERRRRLRDEAQAAPIEPSGDVLDEAPGGRNRTAVEGLPEHQPFSDPPVPADDRSPLAAADPWDDEILARYDSRRAGSRARAERRRRQSSSREGTADEQDLSGVEDLVTRVDHVNWWKPPVPASRNRSEDA